MKKHLQVMKFGGTSVGDASCIARVCEIIKEASRDYCVLVVVSAMSDRMAGAVRARRSL